MLEIYNSCVTIIKLEVGYGKPKMGSETDSKNSSKFIQIQCLTPFVVAFLNVLIDYF